MILITFLTVLVLLIVISMVLLYKFPIRVNAALNSEQQADMYLSITWLSPFLKGLITNKNNHITLVLYLFEKEVLEKRLTNKKALSNRTAFGRYRDYIKLARSLRVANSRIYASYGFDNPALTGVVYGAISMVSQYIHLNEFYNNADFISEHSYFNINAYMEINAARSILKILKGKITGFKANRLSLNR